MEEWTMRSLDNKIRYLNYCSTLKNYKTICKHHPHGMKRDVTNFHEYYMNDLTTLLRRFTRIKEY